MIPSGSLVPTIDPAAWALPAGTALRYERPAAALGSLVASYAVLDSDPAVWKGPDSWVLPGWAQIWVVLTSGTITVQTRKRRPAALGAAMLYGPSSRAMPVTSQGGVTVVIDLTPAGWARWMDRPADEVSDQLLPLDQFWSAARTGDLIARLHASDRGVGVKPVLDQFLLTDLGPAHRDEAALARLCPLLASPAPPAIDAMAAEVGLSASALLRLANRQCGFSPKTLVRRTRFLRAMTMLLMAHDAPDHGAVPAGYHDVPHFLRDAQAFLGLTPRRFLALPMPYLRAVLRARTDVIGAPLPLLD